MSGYLLSIIGTVLICSILTAILPSGKTSAIIKGIAKLACVIAIISPIPQFIKEDVSFDTSGQKNNINLTQASIKTDSSFIEYYCEMRIKSVEEQINTEIADRFDVQTSVDINWCFPNGKQNDTDSIKINNIKNLYIECLRCNKTSVYYELYSRKIL